MKLIEWLKRSGMEAVNHLAGLTAALEPEWGGPFSERGEGSDLTGLVHILRSEIFIRNAWNKMKPWERGAITAAVRAFAFLPFEAEELKRAAPLWSGAHIKAALLSLQRKGVCFGLQKTWGDKLYLIPEDALPVWHDLLFPQKMTDAAIEPETIGHPLGMRGNLAYDLLRTLHDISDHEITLTQKGDVSKHHLKRWKKHFRIMDAELEGAALQLRNSGIYTPLEALVLECSLRLGLVSIQEDRLKANRQTIGAWISQPLDQVMRELYHLWVRHIQTDEPDLLHALAYLERNPAGRWDLLENLFEWLEDYGMIDKISRENFLHSILLPMQALGWIQLMEIPGAGTAYKLNMQLMDGERCPVTAGESMSSAFRGFYVQENYEIIVPPEPPLQVLWELESISEAAAREDIHIYRLTINRIRAAAQNERTSREILAFLQQWALHPISDNLLESVRTWMEQARAVSLHEALLMRFKDKETASVMERYPVCAMHVQEKLNDLVFIIRPGETEALLREMEKLGFYPSFERTQAQDHPSSGRNRAAKTCRARAKNQDAVPGILSLKLSDLPYAASPIPAAEANDLLRRELPVIWWKEYRAYHTSTGKELIRKAIELEVPVRFRGIAGEWEVIPHKLQESKDNWIIDCMKDGRAVQISPGDWKEYKMVFPGMNEERSER